MPQPSLHLLASCFPLSYQEENAALAEAEDTSLSGTASCFLLKEPQTINLSGLSQHLLSTSQRTSNPTLLGSLGRRLALNPGHFKTTCVPLAPWQLLLRELCMGLGLALGESEWPLPALVPCWTPGDRGGPQLHLHSGLLLLLPGAPAWVFCHVTCAHGPCWHHGGGFKGQETGSPPGTCVLHPGSRNKGL